MIYIIIVDRRVLDPDRMQDMIRQLTNCPQMLHPLVVVRSHICSGHLGDRRCLLMPSVEMMKIWRGGLIQELPQRRVNLGGSKSTGSLGQERSANHYCTRRFGIYLRLRRQHQKDNYGAPQGCCIGGYSVLGQVLDVPASCGARAT